MSLPISLKPKQGNQNRNQTQVNEPISLRHKQQEFNVSEEQLQKDIDRNTARSTSRIGEAVLGAPGDLYSFVRGLFGLEQNILPTSSQLKRLSESATQAYTKPQNEFEE